MLIPVLAFTLQATAYPADMERAELCRAHTMLLIADAYKEGGRVAGPSWFIRDWWSAKLNEAQLSDERVAEIESTLKRRRTEDPQAFAAERAACIEEAIKAGAVPGMEP
jgi:hypothetical protein